MLRVLGCRHVTRNRRVRAGSVQRGRADNSPASPLPSLLFGSRSLATRSNYSVGPSSNNGMLSVHSDKENQLCQIIQQGGVTLKVTAQGMQRQPCVRPRCVARRHAVQAFQRSTTKAWVSLIVRAWRQLACASPLEQAAVTLLHIQSCRRQQRQMLQGWAAYARAESAIKATNAVAERCVAAVAEALIGGAAEDTGSTIRREKSPPKQQQSQPEEEEEEEDQTAPESPSSAYLAFDKSTPQRNSSSSSSRGCHLEQKQDCYQPLAGSADDPEQDQLELRLRSYELLDTSRLLLVDPDAVVAAVSEAVDRILGWLQGAVEERITQTGADASLLRRLKGSVSAPVSPLISSMLWRQPAAPSNSVSRARCLEESFRKLGYRDG